jgi:hypothetical protein
MNAEQGFALHPLAAQDITEIWDTSRKVIHLPRGASGKKSSAPFAH